MLHHPWLDLTLRVLATEERLARLRREAATARLLRLRSRPAWQWRLGRWTLRLEREAPRPRPA